MQRRIKLLIGIIVIYIITMPLNAKAASNIRQTQIAGDKVSIQWDEDAVDTSYEVYLWVPTSYWKGTKLYTDYSLQKTGKTNQNSYQFTGLKAGNNYSIVVRAFDAEGDFVSDQQGEITTTPGKVEKTSAKLKWSSLYELDKKKKMTFNMYVDFAAQESATGYEIQLYNSKGKVVKKTKIGAKDASIISHAFRKLKDNSYSAKVRAYKKYNGKTYYGKWSNKIYALRQPKCAAMSVPGKVYIKWEKIKGATKYDIYMRAVKYDKFQKVATVGSKTSMVSIKKFNKKKFKKGSTYYYYVVARNKNAESVLSYKFKVKIK